MRLQEKISQQQAVISIIGLGYVGLPHAVAFAQAGFKVLGLDLNQARVAAVNQGHSDIPDVPSEQLAASSTKTHRIRNFVIKVRFIVPSLS